MPNRLVRLGGGLVAFGLSIALMVNSQLGLGSWDVLHQGLARRLGVEIGVVVVAVGALALLAWIPLGERPGIGTAFNALMVGPLIDMGVRVLPSPEGIGHRLLLLGSGIVVNGVATSLYLGARLGPGPRDGIMTALAARGHSLWLARSGVEVTVLLVGAALGGTVGIGTVAYAIAIGPLVQQFLPRLNTAPGQTRPLIDEEPST